MYPNDITAAEREARYQDRRRAYLRHLAEHAGWVVLDCDTLRQELLAVYDAGCADAAEFGGCPWYDGDSGRRSSSIDRVLARLTGQQEGQQP